MKYPRLIKTLESIFAIDVGLSDASQVAMLQRQLAVDTLREQLRSELLAAWKDESVNWQDLLYNKHYEVYEADSEQDAKRYISRTLWPHIFPEMPSPTI